MKTATFFQTTIVSPARIMYPVLIAGFRLPSAICICSIRIPTGIKTDGKERVTTQRKWFSLRYRQRCGRILGMSQNKVEMESDPFNQQFKVITSDDELAFYILTPQFMEHIVAADEKVDGYTKIEFENSRVTLALNNGKILSNSQRHFGANPVWMKPDCGSAMSLIRY